MLRWPIMRRWFALLIAALFCISGLFVTGISIVYIFSGSGLAGWGASFVAGSIGSAFGMGLFLLSCWCLLHYSIASVKILAAMAGMVLWLARNNLPLFDEAPMDTGRASCR